MNTQYRGMRWLKCDLHMHTNADGRHWAGNQIVSGQEVEAAKEFADACYKTKLDVVGITDHNFLNKDFITHLRSAFEEIEINFGHKITLFPGFEIEADVGKGMHIICLFGPETNIDDIDHILTECGVGRPRIEGGRLAKSTKRLPEILSVVQKPNQDGTWRGIVIVPHVFEDSLFDNDRISEWLQQEEYRNSELLAVEVPKPVSQMSCAFQKLFRSREDCHKDWKRIRPIATLMSSDNKKLVVVDGDRKPVPNSIGYRYSWIKMSEPSIESLRQAFLDHESRIILPEDISTDTHPAARIRQAKIQSINIKNAAFLADQEVHFSPNFNCVIGGRGSGKSTLLEYLRIISGKDNAKDIDSGTKERIQRVRHTLSDDSELELHWRSADGVDDRIVWRNGNKDVFGRELTDPETFFNNLQISFYSQQQLNRLTDSKDGDGRERQAQRLLELIEGFADNELDELSHEERKLKLQIKDAFANHRKSKTLDKENRRLQQERQELDRQLKAHIEIQDDAKKHQQLKFLIRYLDGILGPQGKRFSDVADMADAVAASHIPFKLEDSPHASWFKQFDGKVKEAKDNLARAIRAAVDSFHDTINQLKEGDKDWPAIKNDLDLADENFNKACTDRGLTPDDVGHLQEINLLCEKKQKEIDEIAAEIQRIMEIAGEPESLLQQLHQIWRTQYEMRAEAAERANKQAVLNEEGVRFIEVSVRYQQDDQSFIELWKELSPSDRRTRLGKNWDTVGQILFKLFESSDADSPWQILHDRLSDQTASAGTEFGEFSEELYQYIQDRIENWEALRCSRVQDIVDMKLFRADGSTAGSIAEGSLSDGQRNTAALALLLAQKGGPLVIDQPEDDLDSSFVFKELIPMLRKVKTKRQLIMATHNANLPVNGDAELVYAFEAKNGCGEMLAQGGLDRVTVTKAVLDIMEGTEEAFRRRREKYHF